MISAIFGLFAVLAFFWQTRWQRYPFAIIRGFGLMTIISMLANILRFDFGPRMSLFFTYALPSSYILGCLIWLAAFIKPEPPVTNGQAPPVNRDEMVEVLSKLGKSIR